jgi:hypothetical protein
VQLPTDTDRKIKENIPAPGAYESHAYAPATTKTYVMGTTLPTHLDEAVRKGMMAPDAADMETIDRGYAMILPRAPEYEFGTGL